MRTTPCIAAAAATFLFVALGLPTAANDAPNIEFKSTDARLSDYGYVSRDHLWTTEIVSVCWENPTPDTASARLAVEKAIEQSWERYAHLSFTGWGNACRAGSKGVHLFIADENPRSLIGNRLDGLSKGVRLNMTFQNWGRAYCGEPANRAACTNTVAIHEFGHVLGLIHESLRPNAPPECKSTAVVLQDDSDPGDGDERTAYDPSSIMNYCNLIYGRQSALSSLDQVVAKLMYPTPGD